MATLDDVKMLFAEFPREAISWRAQSMTADGSKAMALAYIDARDVMDRLDQIVGATDWQDRYEFHGSRTICYLSIRVDDEWITKADGAGDSDVEAEKGAISDALKRAAVKWGIGRYLYSLPVPWVPCESYERGGKKHWKRWTADPWSCVKGAPKPAPTPDKPKRVVGTNPETGERTAYSLRREGAEWDQLRQELAECSTVQMITKLALEWSAKVERDKWPETWRDAAREEMARRKEQILNAPAPDDDTFPGDLPNGRNSYMENFRAG